MSEFSSAGFVLLFIAFTACMCGAVLARVLAWALQRYGNTPAARAASEWSGRLGIVAAVFLLLAGALFVRLSQ